MNYEKTFGMRFMGQKLLVSTNELQTANFLLFLTNHPFSVLMKFLVNGERANT